MHLVLQIVFHFAFVIIAALCGYYYGDYVSRTKRERDQKLQIADILSQREVEKRMIDHFQRALPGLKIERGEERENPLSYETQYINLKNGNEHLAQIYLDFRKKEGILVRTKYPTNLILLRDIHTSRFNRSCADEVAENLVCLIKMDLPNLQRSAKGTGNARSA